VTSIAPHDQSSAIDAWVVVMAGGAGKRFWPWSRRAKPKQCLPVVGDESLLRRTLRRAGGLAPSERTVVVTAADNAAAVRLELLGGERVLVEPEGRNTAACVAWAASVVSGASGGHAVIAVLAADHFIGDDDAFVADCRLAIGLAEEGSIVTLGIPPTRPETGYGWIQLGEPLGKALGGVDCERTWQVA
jgi:mannose-1-phosphate guanylyltransferase